MVKLLTRLTISSSRTFVQPIEKVNIMKISNSAVVLILTTFALAPSFANAGPGIPSNPIYQCTNTLDPVVDQLAVQDHCPHGTVGVIDQIQTQTCFGGSVQVFGHCQPVQTSVMSSNGSGCMNSGHGSVIGSGPGGAGCK